jgi:dolichyl-phosphate-mannose--protein O-mannosyl transferase
LLLFFFLSPKLQLCFLKFLLCFLFSLLNTKTLTNDLNTKVYSLKHKTSFHIYVTSKHFFKWKTKYSPKHINKQRRNFFLYILIYSFALSFSSSLHFFFLSSSTFFFSKKKKFTCSFILLLCLFIYLHTFFSCELRCLLQGPPS